MAPRRMPASILGALMNMHEVEVRFARWADGVLSSGLPEGIAAFHLNLYEAPASHDAEIVGCPTYDPTDSDWACEDIFMSEDPRFGLPHAAVGSHWDQGLNAAIQVLKTYLDSDSAGARRLREAQAVSVGFVDGDLHLVWSINA